MDWWVWKVRAVFCKTFSFELLWLAPFGPLTKCRNIRHVTKCHSGFCHRYLKHPSEWLEDKDNSDLVILDDDFRSIHTAIKWGRAIFDNVTPLVGTCLTDCTALICALVFLQDVIWSPASSVLTLAIPFWRGTWATLPLCISTSGSLSSPSAVPVTLATFLFEFCWFGWVFFSQIYPVHSFLRFVKLVWNAVKSFENS